VIRCLLAFLALPAAPQERIPWTTGKLTGSPEAPPPLRTVPAFARLSFTKPTHLVPFPGHRRWVLVQEDAKLFTFRNEPDCARPDLLIDLAAELKPAVERWKGVATSYAIAFDPDFAKNRLCYVMYVLRPADRKPLPDGSRVSRFRVTDADPPRIDPSSEELVIDWLSGGHNGCDLQFGNDGCLYISTGDAEDPSPPDKLRTGQDCTDLLSSVLRIDVRRREGGRAYAIPADNPFAKTPGLRPEIFAYGFRNPWRMSFDRTTGRLWLGDVGWERWELVYCAERGGNYGWSVMEGPTPCLPDAKIGPTPILPPAHAIPHPEAASITGGFVYRGKKLKGFEGKYLYGDWETRRIWANPVRGNALGDREEVARTPARVVAFAEDADGELLVLDYEKGVVLRLEPNDAGARNLAFPRTLSATGLFASVPDQKPAPGVLPFSVHAPRWADGATARRWIGLPGTEAIRMIDKNQEWPKESVWPKDSVLAKTFTLDGRKVETQVLHFDGLLWNGYSYLWNRDQSDAALAPAEGAELDLGGGRRWRAPSRAACMTCHNPWPGYALGFSSQQLREAREFRALGMFTKDLVPAKPLVDPADEAAPLDDRARSYLAANCGHCHRFGGGGSARIDLRAGIPLAEMRIADVPPTLGGFELADPLLACGGDPSRSVLLYRISKLGQGRMPHLGGEVVDERGARLIARWIASLPSSGPPRADDRAALERLKAGELAALDRLLSRPTPAMDLLAALDALPEAARKASIERALALPPGAVRDLFERFEPAERRRKVLGPVIRPEQVLSVAGDAKRGRAIFLSPTLQCARCHRLEPGPETLGPELAKIGAKYTRAQLLESILEPSKLVDPKFAGVIVRTTSGDVLSGIVVSRSDAELVLRDADKETRLKTSQIQGQVPQQKSLMPEGVLQHLTAQEAADLVSFLESLR
jgi:putative heme-binding domain-containing protein